VMVILNDSVPSGSTTILLQTLLQVSEVRFEQYDISTSLQSLRGGGFRLEMHDVTFSYYMLINGLLG